MTELGFVTRKDLAFIAAHLRAADREEIFATRWNESEGVLVDDCLMVAGLPSSHTVVAHADGWPVAVLGACEPWPGMWDVWCFGTDDFDKAARLLTKHALRKVIPLLLARGLRRAHCRSLSTHTKAHAWLRTLGAETQDDRQLEAWGKNGEDFTMFVWHRAKLLQNHKPAEAA